MKRLSILSVLAALVSLVPSVFGQIEAGQTVQIKILGVPVEEKGRIDELYPISETGTVNMPFVGEVKAEGLKASELAKSIERAYREGEIFVDPTIQVIATGRDLNVSQQIVHVGGNVRKTGSVPFTQKLTVFQAIQAAGGADEFGAMNRVILWREDKQEEIDLTKPEGMRMLVQPNDTIQIPQKNWRGK